ncbi:MAG: histidine phosphatase family protein [Alphaproteobacteria bacterium]|nr:histidine phosphatase family protein [Alphaproteobacteria bacterium]
MRVKTILLLRHAKAVPAETVAIDRDRALIDRGVRDCATVGKFLQREELHPDVVLCSSARRTRQTLDGVSAAADWSGRAAIEVRDDLYLASADDIIEALRRQSATINSILVIGHSPGIEEAALRLAAPKPSPQMAALREKFPPCALAVLELDNGWGNIADGSLRLKSFVTPRAIATAS